MGPIWAKTKTKICHFVKTWKAEMGLSTNRYYKDIDRILSPLLNFLIAISKHYALIL